MINFRQSPIVIGGALDFVEKSRSFTILKRRIELIMDGPKGRGADETPSLPMDSLTVGPLRLQPEIGRAYWNAAEVSLTLTEFKIVDYLARREGKDVRYRELYDQVRGEGFVAGIGEDGYRANVRAFIKRIRQKFRGVDDDFDQIQNYPGFGYRWRADE